MSIEDVFYLKKHSMKQQYTFLVDSSDRNFLNFPDPNQYVVEFTQPFRNVIGLEVIDASIPRTMYSVDKYNNSLFFSITEQDVQHGITSFHKIELDIGDYNINTLLREINSKLQPFNILVESMSNPPELLNKIRFVGTSNFILDMNKSTLKNVLGFNLTQNSGSGHRIVHHIRDDTSQFRYFHSKNNIIEAPGIVDLIGEKYIILKCDEIEAHSTRSLSYSKHSLGLAKIRLGVVGYNDENISIYKTQIREFHPIGKLSKITLQFLTADNRLYDFKGVNHNITFNIIYYEASKNIDDEEFTTSHLNPNYNANILEYMKNIDEQDNDSSDDDDDYFSRDDIEDYKKNEEIVKKL